MYGDVRGFCSIHSRSTVFISGDVRGVPREHREKQALSINSKCVVAVEGDVYGYVSVNSDSLLVIGGQLYGGRILAKMLS